MSSIFVGINMFVGFYIEAANPWLGYKRSKAMSYGMEVLCKNDRLFHSRLKAFDNAMAALAKASFNDLQVMQITINGHHEDFSEVHRSFKSFLELTKQFFTKCI